MQGILKQLKEMRADLVNGFKDSNEQNKELKLELEKTNKELQKLQKK